MKTILIDGNSVEVSDAAEIAVKGLMAKLADAEKKLTEAEEKAKQEAEEKDAKDAAIATKDAEITDLKAKLAAAESPAALDAALKDREAVVSKARAILGDKLVVDGKTTAEIRKQVVDAKLGDTAKDWTDAQVDASFAALSVDVKIDPIRTTVANGLRTGDTSITDARQGYLDRMAGRKAS